MIRVPFPERKSKQAWKEHERAAWSSSCSRNAHTRKMHVRRAHSKIDQTAP